MGVSFVSPAYGGRGSDIHIARDSGFLDLLEPFDQARADRGFKIKTDLTLKQCSECIKYCKCLQKCWTKNSKAKRVLHFEVSTTTTLFTNIEWYCSMNQWFSKLKKTSYWLIFLCWQNKNYIENSIFSTSLSYIGNLLKICLILYIFIFHQNMVNLTFIPFWFYVDHYYY